MKRIIFIAAVIAGMSIAAIGAGRWMENNTFSKIADHNAQTEAAITQAMSN